MIHYNVWFSFKDAANELDELAKVNQFLGDLKARCLIRDYTLLKNRAEPDQTKLARFHAAIVIDAADFHAPFEHVAQAGVHAGKHGLMIENVDTFIVEVFDELTTQAP